MTECPTCGANPCVNPSFCAACRKDTNKTRHAADRKGTKQKVQKVGGDEIRMCS